MEDELQFKPDDDGFYRIKESEKNDLKEFLTNQMEDNPRTSKGNLSKKGINTKTIITDGAEGPFEAVFKEKGGTWGWNDKQSLAASGTKRTENLRLSNTLNTAEQQKEFKARAKELPTGIEGDHIYEVQETGPMVEQLESDKGTITTKEYNKRKKILQDTGIGDNPKNFQKLTGKQNTIKQAEVARKNKALELMEMKNPSSRALKLIKNSRITSVTKDVMKNPLVKKAGFIIPGLGLTIAGGIVTSDVKAATQNPSAKNYAKLGLSTFDAGLEVVDTFTAGLSTPVTMALQLATGLARQQLDEGTRPSSKMDMSARRDARR